jgi:hypothetical protein
MLTGATHRGELDPERQLSLSGHKAPGFRGAAWALGCPRAARRTSGQGDEENALDDGVLWRERG